MLDAGNPEQVEKKSQQQLVIRTPAEDKANGQNERDTSDCAGNDRPKKKKKMHVFHRTVTKIRGVKRAEKNFFLAKYMTRLMASTGP